jgi:hypothetical protein
MRDARVALAAGLALTAVALGWVLSRSPPTVARSTAPMTDSTIFGTSDVPSRICQADETLPGGTTAIRVWLEAVIGPPVTVEALSGARVLTRGGHGSGWTAGSVTIPVQPVTRTVRHATVCVTVGRQREPIGIQGVRTARSLAAIDRQGPLPPAPHTRTPRYRKGPLPGRIMVEYLRPGDGSWWSRAVSVARRMGLGRAGSGTWVALLAIVLMVAVAVVSTRAVLEESA